MSNDWTDAKKWPDGDRVAGMLTAIGKIKGTAVSAFAEALPELLVVLKVQRQGIADVYEAVHKITRYNEATHEQFNAQLEIVRTLMKAVKGQDKQIRKLTKRVATLEKKQAGKPRKPALVKKLGWFR
jgi:ABC-type transporter Mla subunit MlaD